MKPKPDKKAKRQRLKAQKKLSKMARKGVLRKHVRDRISYLRREKMGPYEKSIEEVRSDWLIDRQLREQERDYVSSGFDESARIPLPTAKHRRNPNNKDEDSDEMEEDEIREHLRTFMTAVDADMELLPIKIDGRLVKRIRDKEAPAEENNDEKKPIMEMEVEKKLIEKDEQKEKNIGAMSEQERLEYKAKLTDEAKRRLASTADSIVTAPQENVSKFRFLLKMANGEGESPLVRENMQKLAVASMAELFVNVLPGYEIRTLTEAEKSQKMKKATKRLTNYEQNLLNYYAKYLRILEKNAKKLLSSSKRNIDETIFSSQFGFLCIRCMCQLVERLTHFNFAMETLNCLIWLSLCPWRKLLEEICATISRIFATDLQLKISLQCAEAIAFLVNKKAGYVPAQLISTFLSLNINEIEPSKYDKVRGQRIQMKPNIGNSKRARKYDKQIAKIESELKEAVLSEDRSAKLRLATETMNNVFLTYCRILKRMPTTALLRPVLEGLSKFVSLINVELYNDLALHLGKLVEHKQLKFSDVLLCVRTAGLILAGEGQVLDIDLLTFYRSFFAVLPNLCFLSEQAIEKDLSLLVDSMQLLFIRRRKACSLARVASFVKRLALIALPLQTRFQACLLLLLRRLFIAYSGLRFMIQNDKEDDGTPLIIGNFRPDSLDPDHSNSIGTNMLAELSIFSKHPNLFIQSIATEMLNGIPGVGKNSLDAKWTTMDPTEYLRTKPATGDEMAPLLEPILTFCKNKRRTYCSTTVCSILCDFLSDRGPKNAC